MPQETITETYIALTTIDNPFDPIDDFDNWYDYDMEKGYDCCGYLDRVSRYFDGMTEKEKATELERAIDEILTVNPLNIFKKVKRTVEVAV